MRVKNYILYGLLFFLMLPSISFAQDLSQLGEQKPVRVFGNIEARSMFYQASGIENRRAPFSYVLSGSPTLSLYGWQVPFSFTYSKEQASFRQPFNQFGMSPNYKWVTLHAGYRNLSFSPYTLAGHTMLGAGFELKPGKLRTAFMYGRLNRATVIDTASRSLVPFSFSRLGYAAKLGYGTDANFFDLSFLKARDDSTSRPGLFPDSINVLPASNAVLGFKSRFNIINNFYVEGEGAVSVYTEDINSPFILDSLDSPFLEKIKGAFDVNGTSAYFTAFSVGAGYAEKYYGLKVNYRRVDPNFKTMGAYYISNDLEAWTINPTFRLPSGILRGNLSIGTQRNNLNDQKQSTNRRFIGSANLTAQFTPQLGMDLVYTNFSNNQNPKTLSVGQDLKIVQTNQMISIMPRYIFIKNNLNHAIMLSANLSEMKDYNSFLGDGSKSTTIRTKQFFTNYSLTIPQQRINVFTNLNYTILDREIARDTYQGISLGGQYSLAKSKAQLGLNSSLMRGNNEDLGKSTIINASLNGSYQVTKGQSIRMMVFLTKNNPGSAITNFNSPFTETRSEVAYLLTF